MVCEAKVQSGGSACRAGTGGKVVTFVTFLLWGVWGDVTGLGARVESLIRRADAACRLGRGSVRWNQERIERLLLFGPHDGQGAGGGRVPAFSGAGSR